ncbi:MAG: transporter substrate-binding domain-containing protein [Sulfurimonas sp.]|nr:transporter substrate-binding domain-containing protein [Sulfurimonas sp.]
MIWMRFIVIFLIFSSLILEAQLYHKSLKGVILKSAGEYDYPPFSIVTQNRKADGFSIELLRSSVQAMGGDVEFDVDIWDTIKQKLKNGEIDVLPIMGRTEERANNYDFSTHYLALHGTVFTRSDDTRIKTLEDLKDKVIVVMKGDYAEEYARSKNIGKEVVTFDSCELAFKALSSGKYDVVLIQKLVGISLVHSLNLKNIKSSDGIIEDFRQDFCFAVKKGDSDLLALLNEGLAIVVADGTYDKLYMKWFHDVVEISFMDTTLFKKLVFMVILMLLGLLLSYFWVKTLKKQVHQKTMEYIELNQTLESRIEKALTDLKQKEEVMIIQSRHAAMGEMISMIAHQWRQPISSIAMGANNMIVDLALGKIDKDSLSELALDIINQTQHLSKTIDDFRNFFKPNKIRENINVCSVLEDALLIIGDSFVNNNIVIEKEFDCRTLIATYSRELLQVYLNILKNAKEALLENKIKDATVVIRITEDNNSVITTICDNAGGIKPELLTKIFEPYFTTKDEENGTGLGLYISKIIVYKHLNGRLSVKNSDNGACFSVVLPKHLSDSVTKRRGDKNDFN